jgi:hypothetical protein
VGWRAGDPNNGLYLSNDAGKTFTFIGSPPGFASQPEIGRVSLGVGGPKGLIYAVVQDAACFNAGFCPPGTILNGVYKSSSGPMGPWIKVADANQLAADSNSAQDPAKIGPGYQPGIGSWYNQYVKIDPTDPNHVVLGLEEIYDTTDGGTTWHTIGRYWNFCLTSLPPNCNLDPDQHPTTHPDQHAAAFGVVKGRPKLFVGNDGGVWSQKGPGFDNDSWTDLNSTLSLTQPYYVESSAGPNPTMYIGTQDNGTDKYTGGATWPEVFGGDGGDVAVEPANPDNTYEEYVYLNMYKSDDGGATWTNIDTPDSNDSGTARFIAPFDLDPTNVDHLVAVGQHVWESDQGIATTSSDWTESYDNGSGHVGTALAVRGSTVYDGWCGPCNPAVIDADAPFARGLATNQGGTWHAAAATGLPNRYITSITIDPANESHIYVTLSAFSRRWIPRAGEGHVFESTNAGATFTDISSNLPDAPANDTVLVGGSLVVGTDVGAFVRLGGGTWATLGTGLPAVSVLDLSVIPGSSTVVAGTHGRGVWTLDLD